MRLMSLAEMLTELRHEARISDNMAHGAHQTARHSALLRRVQEEVYHAYDWPNLKTTADRTLGGDQRVVTYPDTLDFEGLTAVYAKSPGGKWLPLDYGIGAQEYNEVDSNSEVLEERTREQVLRWQNYVSPSGEALNQNMLEVWPIPISTTQLRFEGKRKLFPLINTETDNSTVDGIVIVLHAAAELLAGNKAEDATLKIKKAQARYDLLKQRAVSPDNRKIILGGGAPVQANSHRFRY